MFLFAIQIRIIPTVEQHVECLKVDSKSVVRYSSAPTNPVCYTTLVGALAMFLIQKVKAIFPPRFIRARMI